MKVSKQVKFLCMLYVWLPPSSILLLSLKEIFLSELQFPKTHVKHLSWNITKIPKFDYLSNKIAVTDPPQ